MRAYMNGSGDDVGQAAGGTGTSPADINSGSTTQRRRVTPRISTSAPIAAGRLNSAPGSGRPMRSLTSAASVATVRKAAVQASTGGSREVDVMAGSLRLEVGRSE